MSHSFPAFTLSVAAVVALSGPTLADELVADDLIVQGSACIGLDCVVGQSFANDTLRLVENNVRLRFTDTSIGAFPSTDWTLVANETANGGKNRFSIFDATASRLIFSVEGGAPAHSIYVEDAQGRVGFGTSNPLTELHVVDGETPTLRLEQDGSSGFTAQTWDLAGNEAGFFIRDETANTLPFRIRPGAPNNAVFINDDGDIGIGHTIPSSALHVRRSDDKAQVRVEETNGTTSARTLLLMQNNGAVRTLVENTANSAQWLTSYGGDVRIAPSNDVADQVFLLAANGNLIIDGTLTENSDKNAKMAIEPVDPAEVLEKLSQLQVSHWTYKDDDPSVRHMGPMAQDFYAAFGLGGTDKGISTLDSAGVALAAIQALQAQAEAQQAEIAALRAELEALKN